MLRSRERSPKHRVARRRHPRAAVDDTDARALVGSPVAGVGGADGGEQRLILRAARDGAIEAGEASERLRRAAERGAVERVPPRECRHPAERAERRRRAQLRVGDAGGHGEHLIFLGG